MSGSVKGGKLAAKTNKKRYGRNFYAEIGAKGGKNSNTGGTYGRPEFASRIGSIGGRRSKRGYRLIKESEDGLHYIDNATGMVVVFKHDTTLENH